MTGEVLIDTNVVVYQYSDNDPARQARATDVLQRLSVSARGRLSTQVLGEVFRVLTAKRRSPISRAEALAHLEIIAHAWPVHVVTPNIVLEAARGVRDYRLNYWDAQLWATARLNQISTILTEDIPGGDTLEGIRYLNPFAAAFDLASIS
jgi:predicted nucleic acid-binding protein